MACNCGKSRKNPPTGAKASGGAKPNGSTSTSLNTSSGKTQRFTLRKPDGTTKQYGSRLEAQADQARYGGSLTF